MSNFDLVVIGGGPGGYPLAIKMAKSGWNVALVEKNNEVGGTCLNWGCIPTKSLLASAKGFHFLKEAESFGLKANDIDFDWEKVQTRKNGIVSKLRQGINQLLKKAGVTVYTGVASVHKNNKIIISGDENTEISADKICLAIGSEPTVPPVFPEDKDIFWTSNEALSADSIPESLLVIGGGVIGIELGQVFSEFGSKVAIVEMQKQMLPALDSATAKRLMPAFKKKGIEFLLGKKVEKLEAKDGKAVAVISDTERTFDKVLIAVGRKTNLQVLENSDLELELENGFIQTNSDFETSEKGIFAIGDAIKGPMLAHKATYDALILAEKWLGNSAQVNYLFVPSCVYTYPEIAWVGMSEDLLKANNIEYKVGRSMFAANGKALTVGQAEGQIKVCISSDGKLLGAVIWGPEASNLISEATIMAGADIDAKAFAKIVHPHPTLSEAFLEAVENASGHGVHS